VNKTIHTQVKIYGYLTGETAFQDVFARACSDIPGFADSFEAEVMAPLVAVQQDPNQAGHLQILGLADRVDTAGLSREDIRQQEFQASQDRASTASDAVFSMLNDRVGGQLGSDWGSVANIAEISQGIGACTLAQSDANLSEDQRQQNRRVTFQFVQFTP
jgi:hypothetical protein